jgi:phosphoribosylformylglycinamidine (FGAM) synthase PurS component
MKKKMPFHSQKIEDSRVKKEIAARAKKTKCWKTTTTRICEEKCEKKTVLSNPIIHTYMAILTLTTHISCTH